MKPPTKLHELSTKALKHELDLQNKLVCTIPLNSPQFASNLKRLEALQSEWNTRLDAIKKSLSNR